MRKSFLKKTWKDYLFDGIIVCFLIVLVIVTLYPFINQLAISLNDSTDAIKGGIYLWPRQFSLDAYRFVFQNDELFKATVMSLLRVVIGTTTGVFATAQLAYIVTIKNFSGKRFLRRLFIITMYFSGGLIPFYLLIVKLGLTDSFTVYWLPSLISAYHMLIIASYMQEIPNSLTESAMLDGAGYFQIFIKIILPISVPVIAAICVFTGVRHWNSWFDVMIYNPSGKFDTLQVFLRRMLLEVEALENLQDQQAAMTEFATLTAKTVRAATTMIVTIPIALIYPFFQKYFISGITMGAVKE